MKNFKPVPGQICKHPPDRLFSWFAKDARYEKPILCVCCCECGAILAGQVK